MKRALFDIWEDMTDIGPFPYRVQMVNYVAHLPSNTAATKLVSATKKAREQDAKAVTSGKTAQQNRKS